MEKREVRVAWDEISEEYAQKRDASGSDAALIDGLLEDLGEEARVLDIGCGDGARTLANLPEGVGIDISRRGLELARENVPSAPLVQGDMAKLPFKDASFDGVTAYHSVFHVPRDEHRGVYEEFARVLRGGGCLLMTLPGGSFETVRRGWMGGRMLFSAPGRRKTLEQLRDSGFGDLQTETADDPLGNNTEFVFATKS